MNPKSDQSPSKKNLTYQRHFDPTWSSRDGTMNQWDQGLKGIKSHALFVKNSHSDRMSTSWEYGDVSPARYPNPGRKRKSRSAKSSHPAGKKKKEKEKEVIQNDPAVVVEVMQEGVSYPQTSEEETKQAVQELMNELSVMDQATQTPPPQPTLDEMFHKQVKLVGVYDTPEEFAQALKDEKKLTAFKHQTPPPPPEDDDDNEGMKRLVRMATIFQSPAFQNPRPRPPPSSVDYMVCPCHEVRLEERQSQKRWEYVKCPIHPCLLFCAKEKAYDYMREVYRQPHPDVCDLWNCLLCFCREPVTLQLSQSQDNPNRLFMACSKKKSKFFR